MSRTDYVRRVLRLYLDAPETPERPRRSDWNIARSFADQRIPMELIDHALALACLRRSLRPPEAEPLEPIRSLAYIRPLLEHLRRTGLDPGYRDYIAAKYEELKA